MAELRISFPKELKSEMEAHPEIDWAVVFKKAALKILHRLSLAEFIESKLTKSEFTEEDAERLGESAKLSRLKELKSQGII